MMDDTNRVNHVPLGSGSSTAQYLCIGQWNSQSLAPKKQEFELLLNQEKIGICLISETWLSCDTILRFKGYNIYRKDRDDGYGGVAILVHSSIKTQIHPVHIANSGIEIICVKILNCKYIQYVASIYCPGSVRTSQLDWDELFSKFSTKSIVAGDFNGHHPNWSSKQDARGLQLFDASVDNNFVSLNSGDFSRIKLVNNLLQKSTPDISFVTTDLAILFKSWCVTRESLGSDHLFVKYCLEYYEAPEYVKRRNFKLANWKLYHDTCKTSFSNNSDYDCSDNVQLIYTFFVKTLSEAADHSIPYVRNYTGPAQSFKPKHYWTPSVSHAIAKRRLALKAFRKNPTPGNLDILNKCIAEAQRTLRQAISSSWKRFCGEIDETTSSSEMWRKMRWMKGVRGNRAHAPDEEKERLLCSLAPDCCQPPEPVFHSRNTQLESEFSSQELYNCLRKKDSAPGEDEITYSMVFYLPIEGKMFLLKIYNLIFKYAIIPEQWRNIKIIPIPKPNTDNTQHPKFRPISLISCLCKIFHTMLTRRLEWYFERNRTLAQTTSGFRRGQSSVDCVVRFVSQIQIGFAKNIPTLACFLDIDGAYNNVLVEQLVIILDKLEVGTKICNYLYGFLKRRYLKITNENEGNTFVRCAGRGLAQGDPISPLLFNIVTAEISHSLISGVQALQYADDYVFYVQNANIPYSIGNMQTCLNYISSLLHKIGLEMSVTKTKICLFKRGRSRDQVEIRVDDHSLPVVDCFRYLGVWLDRSLRWSRHIREVQERSNKMINIIKILAGASWGVHPKHLRRIYISLIRSRIDYASFIYDSAAKTHLVKLDRVQNVALRAIGGFIKSTPIHVMECELCIPPLHLRREFLATKYCLKSQAWSDNLTVNIIKNLSNVADSPFFRRNKNSLLSTVYSNTKVEILNSCNPLNMFTLDTWVSNINMDYIKIKVDDIVESKNCYDNRILKYNTLHMLNNKYSGWHSIYTDGSQTKDGSGAAYYVSSQNIRESFRIVNEAHTNCIMSVELFAISEALSYAISARLKRVVILSDSRSALQHVARCTSGYRGASIAYTIIRKVSVLVSGGASLIIQWIPSHVGIHGNEEADKLAREAISKGTEVYLKSEFSEILFKYRRWLKKKWKEYFDIASREKGIWYRTLQSEPPHVPWFANTNLPRKIVVIAHRIRSGHMPLNSFKFLMKKVDSPNCECCGVKEDTYHFLRECARSKCIRDILTERYNINWLDVGLYQSVLADQTSEVAIMLYQSTYGLVNV